jgi:hypothetical protein
VNGPPAPRSTSLGVASRRVARAEHTDGADPIARSLGNGGQRRAGGALRGTDHVLCRLMVEGVRSLAALLSSNATSIWLAQDGRVVHRSWRGADQRAVVLTLRAGEPEAQGRVIDGRARRGPQCRVPPHRARRWAVPRRRSARARRASHSYRRAKRQALARRAQRGRRARLARMTAATDHAPEPQDAWCATS